MVRSYRLFSTQRAFDEFARQEVMSNLCEVLRLACQAGLIAVPLFYSSPPELFYILAPKRSSSFPPKPFSVSLLILAVASPLPVYRVSNKAAAACGKTFEHRYMIGASATLGFDTFNMGDFCALFEATSHPVCL